MKIDSEDFGRICRLAKTNETVGAQLEKLVVLWSMVDTEYANALLEKNSIEVEYRKMESLQSDLEFRYSEALDKLDNMRHGQDDDNDDEFEEFGF